MKDMFGQACKMFYDWQNDNGVSQSDFLCFCEDHNLNDEEVEVFVDAHEEEYQLTNETWESLSEKK